MSQEKIPHNDFGNEELLELSYFDQWDFIDANRSGEMKGVCRFKILLTEDIKTQLKLLIIARSTPSSMYLDMIDIPVTLQIMSEDGTIVTQEWELGLLLSFAVSDALGRGGRWIE